MLPGKGSWPRELELFGGRALCWGGGAQGSGVHGAAPTVAVVGGDIADLAKAATEDG